LDVEDGKHILLRDTPQSFATTACKVLADKDIYLEFGVAGRSLILESYTWDAIARIMDDAWRLARV
jgi:glycosyltransferase involved in cell wall biosynthesis